MLSHGWRLAIAGEGDQGPLLKLADRCGISDRLKLLGHVPNPESVMAAADVMVHASDAEGVPQVVIQALAAGKPVVATEVIGLREVDDANIAIVPLSGTGLAEAVKSAIEAPAPAVAATALSQWSPPAIERDIAAFHARMNW
jgi:glycosyltransferase involved in cell wall biosynthesis